MLPEQKKRAVAIFTKHKKERAVDCVTELSETVKVRMKDIQHLRVCLDAAEADPSHLDMVAAAPATATVLTAEGVEAAAAMEDANHGLVNFQLVPKVGASCQ